MRDIVEQTGYPAVSRHDDQFVDVGIPVDNRCGVGLDDVGDVGVRILPPERAEERRREDHVANRAQPDEQNAHYSWSTVASSISITGMSSLMG